MSALIDTITSIVVDNMNELFRDKLHDVILFGSYSKGNFDEGSDIDIIVLVNLSQDELLSYRHSIYTLSSVLSLEYEVTVSIKIKSFDIVNRYKDTVPFYENVLTQGKHIYAKQ